MRSRLGSSFSTMLTAKLRAASASSVVDCRTLWIMSGLNTFSSRKLWAAPTVTADVIADHLGAHHRQRLALGRVRLARHDAATETVCGDDQLRQARSRPGSEQADVVAQFVEAGCDYVQHARCFNERVMRPHAFKLVRIGREGQPGERADPFTEHGVEISVAIEAGANSGATLGQAEQPRQGTFEPRHTEFNLPRPGVELLSQGDRDRVHHVRAPDLNDVAPRSTALLEAALEQAQCRDQRVDNRFASGHVHDSWEAIVAALAAVDVIIRVDRRPAATRLAESFRWPGSRSPRWRSY